MKVPANLLQLDQQVCFALYRASRAIVRAYGPLLKPLGLTYPQYLVMLVVWEQDGLPVKDIGERLALDSATLTPVLKKLEQQDLISRKRSPDDERVVQIYVTKTGKALKSKAQSIPVKLACMGGFDVQKKADADKIASLRADLHGVADRYFDASKHEGE